MYLPLGTMYLSATKENEMRLSRPQKLLLDRLAERTMTTGTNGRYMRTMRSLLRLGLARATYFEHSDSLNCPDQCFSIVRFAAQVAK